MSGGKSSAASVRHRLEYVAVRAFAALVRILPVSAAFRVARLGGRVLHLVDRAHVRIARENVRARYRTEDGEPLAEAEVRRMVRRVFGHIVTVGVEMVLLDREISRGRFRPAQQIEGVEHVREALARGKGVIFVSAHLGNWEVFGAAARRLGLEPASVYRPLDNPYLDRWLRGMRGFAGQEVIPKKGAVRGIMRVLRRGGQVAILVDQDARRRGVFVPFFGTLASTIPTPAELALRTGAAVVPGFSVRTGDGFRFRNWFEPALEIEDTGERDEDVLRITAELNQRVEAAVRQAPDQWLWAHRRWKSVPHPLPSLVGTPSENGAR